jgi:methylase of polypeptide subunit release factors
MRELSERQQKFNGFLRARLDMNRSLGTHDVPYGGFVFAVHEQVFSPKVFSGWRYYTPLLSSRDLSDKRLLEVGCGCGITGLYLAATQKLRQLVLADINPHAVNNAKHNAKRLGLDIDVAFYQSDVFDGIPRSSFDVIYWNHPWEQEKTGYRHRDELEKGLFDGGYAALAKFLKGLDEFLEPSGYAVLGFGTSADLHVFYKLCHQYGFHPYEVTDRGNYTPEYILYELRRAASFPPLLVCKATILRRQHLAILKARLVHVLRKAVRLMGSSVSWLKRS